MSPTGYPLLVKSHYEALMSVFAIIILVLMVNGFMKLIQNGPKVFCLEVCD